MKIVTCFVLVGKKEEEGWHLKKKLSAKRQNLRSLEKPWNWERGKKKEKEDCLSLENYYRLTNMNSEASMEKYVIVIEDSTHEIVPYSLFTLGDDSRTNHFEEEFDMCVEALSLSIKPH